MEALKVFVNRRVIQGAWGGGNAFLKALTTLGPQLGLEFVREPKLADVSFLMGIDRADGLPSAFELLSHPKTLFRVNECDRRKATSGVDAQVRAIMSHTTQTVFVSEWLKKEIVGSGPQPVVYNSCDFEVFKPTVEKYSRHNGKTNIVCHHWSSNRLKGADYYEFLKGFVETHSSFTFTYIGRTEVDLPPGLRTTSPEQARHIEPLWGAELGDELARYDVCVNASRCDPGPNSVLETITCGLPTYVHVDGGGGREFAGEDHVFGSFDELKTILLGGGFKKNSLQIPSWEQCIKCYVKLLKSL